MLVVTPNSYLMKPFEASSWLINKYRNQRAAAKVLQNKFVCAMAMYRLPVDLTLKILRERSRLIRKDNLCKQLEYNLQLRSPTYMHEYGTVTALHVSERRTIVIDRDFWGNAVLVVTKGFFGNLRYEQLCGDSIKYTSPNYSFGNNTPSVGYVEDHIEAAVYRSFQSCRYPKALWRSLVNRVFPVEKIVFDELGDPL